LVALFTSFHISASDAAIFFLVGGPSPATEFPGVLLLFRFGLSRSSSHSNNLARVRKANVMLWCRQPSPLRLSIWTEATEALPNPAIFVINRCPSGRLCSGERSPFTQAYSPTRNAGFRLSSCQIADFLSGPVD
jgi:hypothetical protein